MVAWFIIAIATLAVFGFIAVNGVQTVAMTSDAAARVETVRRLDAAVSALLARAASPAGNGVVYLPAGRANPTGQGYGLPVDMALMGTTPFGRFIVYCPFGDPGITGTAATIRSANNTTYSVATQAFEGRTYVVGGRPAYPSLSGQPNLVGFVMAPRTKLSTSPSCNQVVYNTTAGKYEAPDAVVRPISREAGIDESRTVDARRLTFYVSPTGTGKGDNPSDPTSLATAINFYKSRLPAFMTINMATGNYIMGPSDLLVDYQTSNFQSNLTMNGVANGTFVDMSSQGDIQIPGHFVATGITFDQDVNVTVMSGSKLSMYYSSVGSIESHGEVSMSGSNAITQSKSTYAISAYGNSKLFLSGTVNFYNPYGIGVRVSGDGMLSASNAQITFNTANSGRYDTGVVVLPGAKATFNNSVLNFPVGTAYAIRTNGEVTLQDSNIQFSGSAATAAINAYAGARVGLYSAYIGLGTRPVRGVLDSGALEVHGSAVSIYAVTRCWEGPQFVSSAHGNGTSSVVQANVNPAALPAAPTPAQIQAYADVRAANAQKAASRLTNQSNWTCIM